jgi:branched-chain amino acid transport system permease protein
MSHLPDILQYLISGLALGSIYAIVAVGFTIIFSSTQIVNFAQGEFVMLGAMFSYTLAVVCKWPVALAVPAAALAAMVVGMLLGWVLMRPLKDASPTSLIIITVGVSMLLQGAASMVWGKDPLQMPAFSKVDYLSLTLPQKLTGPDAYPVMVNTQELWVMGLVLVMVLALTLFFNRTMLGKAMRAVAVNRHGARLVGVNVSRMVVIAFALSAAIGALAGATIAPISMASYGMGTMMGLKGFAAAIVGGLGNFTGSIVAGILLGVMETFGAGYLSSQYKDAFAFIILLVVLIISPNGILALWRARRAAR